MSQVELGDGLGPHADPDPLWRRGIRLDQHLPQVLVHLQNRHALQRQVTSIYTSGQFIATSERSTVLCKVQKIYHTSRRSTQRPSNLMRNLYLPSMHGCRSCVMSQANPYVPAIRAFHTKPRLMIFPRKSRMIWQFHWKPTCAKMASSPCDTMERLRAPPM